MRPKTSKVLLYLGCWGERADGKIVGPFTKSRKGREHDEVCPYTAAGRSYTQNGQFIAGNPVPHRFDIVKVYSERPKAPAKPKAEARPKKAPVTKEAKMEPKTSEVQLYIGCWGKRADGEFVGPFVATEKRALYSSTHPFSVGTHSYTPSGGFSVSGKPHTWDIVEVHSERPELKPKQKAAASPAAGGVKMRLGWWAELANGEIGRIKRTEVRNRACHVFPYRVCGHTYTAQGKWNARGVACSYDVVKVTLRDPRTASEPKQETNMTPSPEADQLATFIEAMRPVLLLDRSIPTEVAPVTNLLVPAYSPAALSLAHVRSMATAIREAANFMLRDAIVNGKGDIDTTFAAVKDLLR